MLTVTNPKNTDWAAMSLEDLAAGNALDIYFTYKIDDIIESSYDSTQQQKLVNDVMCPLLIHVARMEYQGIDISEKNMQTLNTSLMSAIIEKEDFLYSVEGVEPSDNLNSSQDIGKILYEREGAMELYPPDWTEKGKPKTCKNTLAILLEQIDYELEQRIRSSNNR